MAPSFLLEVMILASFIAVAVFMFLPPKNETVHKIFVALGVMLGVFVTVIDATSLPPTLKPQIIAAWFGLVPAALGVIISVSKGKPNALAKILVLFTSVFGAIGYFFFA